MTFRSTPTVVLLLFCILLCATTTIATNAERVVTTLPQMLLENQLTVALNSVSDAPFFVSTDRLVPLPRWDSCFFNDWHGQKVLDITFPDRLIVGGFEKVGLIAPQASAPTVGAVNAVNQNQIHQFVFSYPTLDESITDLNSPYHLGVWHLRQNTTKWKDVQGTETTIPLQVFFASKFTHDSKTSRNVFVLQYTTNSTKAPAYHVLTKDNVFRPSTTLMQQPHAIKIAIINNIFTFKIQSQQHKAEARVELKLTPYKSSHSLQKRPQQRQYHHLQRALGAQTFPGLMPFVGPVINEKRHFKVYIGFRLYWTASCVANVQSDEDFVYRMPAAIEQAIGGDQF